MGKEEKYINIQTGEELNWDRVSRLKDNSMLKVRPELWCEWNFEKNNELGLDIWEMTKGMECDTHWECKKCNSVWDSFISNRIRGRNCPYCKGLRVNHTNSLASLRPDLAKEWHPTKNRGITPDQITWGSSRDNTWWQCDQKHEWKATIASRNGGNGCPYCAGQKAWVGDSDMWTTNSELAKLLVDSENGYRYMENSNIPMHWKCNCGNIIKNKKPGTVNKYGLGCPKCSDGISYPEKLMHNLLNTLKVDYKHQVIFKWAKDKRYDFYIKDLNMIIETHGGQHFTDNGFCSLGGRSLMEEMSNDKLKYELATINNIDNYIMIDCKESNLEYIKRSIINSRLGEFFDLSKIDWIDIDKKSQKSILLNVCEFYSTNPNLLIKDVAEKFKLSSVTINKYLKQGSKIGVCDYSKEKSRITKGASSRRRVVQLTSDYQYLNTWDGIRKASKSLGINETSICNCCRGRCDTYKGFKWMYKEDYEKYIEQKNVI